MKCQRCLALGLGVCLCFHIFEALPEAGYNYEHTHEDHLTSPTERAIIAGSTAVSNVASSTFFQREDF